MSRELVVGEVDVEGKVVKEAVCYSCSWWRVFYMVLSRSRRVAFIVKFGLRSDLEEL